VTGTSSPASPGRRERGKLERRRRIELAARAVFQERGFDRATTREIAERADVSSATLFVYATEKRQLLLMLYRDDLVSLGESAFLSMPRDACLLVQLEHLFRPRYAFWALHPDLSRHVIRELAREVGPDSNDAVMESGFRGAFLALRDRVATLIAEHQAAGNFASDVDARDVARLIMHIYLSEQRAWLDGRQPIVEDGMATLRHFLSLQLRGFTGGTL
jgi:AcrR family transcriptional regulator